MTRVELLLCAAALSLGACAATPEANQQPEMISVQNSGPAMTPIVQDLYETPRCEMFLSSLALAEKKTEIYPSIHAL